MQRFHAWSVTLLALLLIAAAPQGLADASGANSAEPAVTATVDCTLRSERRHIRQFVFDGDEATYYESADNIGDDTSFTLKLDKAVDIKSVTVLSGNNKGEDLLQAGLLEAAGPNGEFREVARFDDGKATAESLGQVKTLRIRPEAPKEGEGAPLVIREITIDSDPQVATFEYPVEFFVVVEDADDLEKWAEACARLCERQYPMINRELASEGFTPPTAITMRLTSEYQGVAAASGRRIVGSVEYFRRHQDDMGAMVHETAHVVQSYRSRNNPGWLVEGVADYIRFVIYEPENIGPLRPRQVKYNDSYRTSARFLAYVTDTYDKEIVKKLNKAMREGEYRDELWQEFTGKSLADLGAEWYDSINAPKQPAPAAES
jgi:hypothetical protein